MIENKRILGLVPARGGSKGVLRKNIRMVCGKPLMVYTIESAKKSIYLDNLVVSSEDKEILSIAKNNNALSLTRPIDLSQDESSSIDVIDHAITEYDNFDYIVLLQPTSPLRRPCDIDNAIKLCYENDSPLCISVCETKKSPYRVFTINSENTLEKIMSGSIPNRRQDMPVTYELNGAIYVINTKWFIENKNIDYKNALPYVMPYEYSLDVDTEDDLCFFEYRYAHK